MSTREFWSEEPELLWTYRKSYIEKLKLQQELDNYNAWLIGLYNFDALSKSLYNSFGRRNYEQVQNYIAEPIDFNKKPKSKAEIERERMLEVERKIKERNKQIKEMLSNKKK